MEETEKEALTKLGLSGKNIEDLNKIFSKEIQVSGSLSGEASKKWTTKSKNFITKLQNVIDTENLLNRSDEIIEFYKNKTITTIEAPGYSTKKERESIKQQFDTLKTNYPQSPPPPVANWVPSRPAPYPPNVPIATSAGTIYAEPLVYTTPPTNIPAANAVYIQNPTDATLVTDQNIYLNSLDSVLNDINYFSNDNKLKNQMGEKNFKEFAGKVETLKAQYDLAEETIEAKSNVLLKSIDDIDAWAKDKYQESNRSLFSHLSSFLSSKGKEVGSNFASFTSWISGDKEKAAKHQKEAANHKEDADKYWAYLTSKTKVNNTKQSLSNFTDVTQGQKKITTEWREKIIQQKNLNQDATKNRD